MNHERKVVLWSQPIISGRTVGPTEVEQGMGSLLLANVSKRKISVRHECYDRLGTKISQGNELLEPGHVGVSQNLTAGQSHREFMYCKIWYQGSKNDIRASLIMSTFDGGTPGSEKFTPVYAVSFS